MFRIRSPSPPLSKLQPQFQLFLLRLPGQFSSSIVFALLQMHFQLSDGSSGFLASAICSCSSRPTLLIIFQPIELLIICLFFKFLQLLLDHVSYLSIQTDRTAHTLNWRTVVVSCLKLIDKQIMRNIPRVGFRRENRGMHKSLRRSSERPCYGRRLSRSW